MLKKLLLTGCCTLGLLSAKAQLFIDTNYTIEQMINGFFGSSGDSISNIAYTGSPVSLAFFEGSQSNIGLNAGLFISTGEAISAVGPNISGGTTGNNNNPGHPWLDALVPGYTTLDASLVQLSITPVTDTLRFKYVFASEEYQEFVNTQFNDVFAFFINGPGLPSNDSIYVAADTIITPAYCVSCVDTFLILTEPYCYQAPFDSTLICYEIGDTLLTYCVNDFCGYDTTYYPSYWYTSPGGLNIAMVPNTNLPVAINNLNQFINTAYFVENDGGQTVEFDAFSTPLWAEIPVTPGETYTVTIAIADAGDWAFDSGIFLSIESIGGDSLLPVNVAFDALVPPPGGGNTVNFENNTFWATEWSWDFGDGAISTERTPEHTYAAPGTYTVQLKASNWCSTETFTQTVQLGVSGTNEPAETVFQVSPNPTHGLATLQLHQAANARVRVTNLEGRTVLDRTLNNGATLPLTDQPNGVYTVQVITNGQVFTQKLVKI